MNGLQVLCGACIKPDSRYSLCIFAVFVIAAGATGVPFSVSVLCHKDMPDLVISGVRLVQRIGSMSRFISIRGCETILLKSPAASCPS